MAIVSPSPIVLLAMSLLLAGQFEPSASQNTLSLNSPCQTPDRLAGNCIFLQQCSSLYALIQKQPLYQTDRDFLRQSQCGYDRQPMVCCAAPTSSVPTNFNNNAGSANTNLLPQPGVCGVDSSQRIIGGEITLIDEFPWMVLIQYSKPNNRKGFHCGGVLISDRYVLTAAHCVAGKDLKQLRWDLTGVRLGEWDTESERDCDNGDCSDPVVDMPVEQLIAHESYNPNSKTQEHDIALIRLTQPITFTDWIKPICLPTGDHLRQSSYDDVNLEVAGWGKTETVSFSNKKLKVNVKGVNLSQCNQVYGRHNVQLGAGQMCAGGEKGMDSCRGDSGGPLMTIDKSSRSPYWYCAGIVSFGPTPCGMAGWPGVYTKVNAYTDWIVQNMRP